MKKCLLLIIILFFPFCVYAEGGEKDVSFVNKYNTDDVFSFMKSGILISNTYKYAEGYNYQNGVYTLVNPVSRNLSNAPSKFYYTCESTTETSCETLYAVYVDYQNLINQARLAYPAFILKDGHTEDEYYSIQLSDSYTKEGNQYVLTNPIEEETLRLTRKRPNDQLNGKYYCLNLGDRCDDLYLIAAHFDGSIFLIRVKDDFVYGNGFDYQDGKYILKGIVSSQFPEFDKYIGTYSCMNQETSCDTLYKIISYSYPSYTADNALLEMYELDHMVGVPVTGTVKDISMMKTDTYGVQEYIQDADEIWIEDESIVKIENGVLVPLKKGTTTILFKKDQEVYLLHVDIQDVEEPNVNNPETSTNILLMILFVGILCFVFLFAFKKWNDKHKKIVEE